MQGKYTDKHQLFSREDSWCFLLEFCFCIDGIDERGSLWSIVCLYVVNFYVGVIKLISYDVILEVDINGSFGDCQGR